MTVYRSPFKTSNPKPIDPYAAAPSEVPKTYGADLAFSVPKSSSSTASDSSFEDEKKKLDKSVKEVSSRIKSIGDRQRIIDEAKGIAAGKKNKGWTDKGIVGFLKNSVAKPVIEPFSYAMGEGSDGKLTKALTVPQKFVESVFAYGAESIVNAPANLLDVTNIKKGTQPIAPTSVKEVFTRANNPEWSTFKDDKYKTGIGWLDKTYGVITMLATDPLNYVGVGELQYAGRAGRSALALRFGSTEMLEKYPQMAGLLDDVVRYGAAAIPKEIRAAEGITNGLRVAGKIVPKTEGVANALIAPVTSARTAVGDALFKYAPNVQKAVTPASRLVGVEYGVGYRSRAGLGATDEIVVAALANTSAQRYGKALATDSFGRWAWESRDIVKAAKDINAVDDIVNLIEDPIAYAAAKPEAQAVADSFKAWQSKVRGEVNDVYAKFGQTYGTDIAEVGFVEDFVHHKITKDAREWVFGAGKKLNGAVNPRTGKQIWTSEHLSATDLTNNIGTVRYRKLTAGSEFMGEVLQTGTIKEINEISQRVAGVKWFETDLASVADSYAYSMAKTRGREAWARRMMDFGPDYIKPLIEKSIPSKDLVETLSKNHTKLRIAQRELREAVSIGGKTVAAYGRRSIKLAEQVLTKQGREVTANAAKIAKIRAALDKVEVELVQAYEAAGKLSAAERGSFGDVHKSLYEMQRTLRAALDGAEQTHGAALQVLKEHYAELFPNARSIPNNPDQLAEAILRKNKINVTKETKYIDERMEVLAKQIDEMPNTAEFEETRSAMMDELNNLQDHKDGIDAIADVRMNASYSPDGFVYGYTDDFLPLPEGVEPYRRLTTYQPDPNFPTNPEAVAMHAPDELSLIDLRVGQNFRDVFGNPDMAQVLGAAVRNAGLDNGDAFLNQARLYYEGADIDPMFSEFFPEQAQLIEMMDDFAKMPHDELDNDMIVMAFDALDDQLRHVATAGAEGAYDEVDSVARQMMDDIIGGIINYDKRQGMIIPSVISNIEHPDLVGKFDVLMSPKWYDNIPKRGWSNPADPVQRVADSTMVQRILDKGYESASLDTYQRIDDVAKNLIDTELTAAEREVLAAEKRSLAGKKGAVTKSSNKKVNATEAAMKQYEESKTITVTINGKRTKLTREQGIEMIASVDKQVAKQEAALEKVIKQIEKDAGLPQLLKRQATLQERLPMLFNQAEVLQRWTDEVGVKLQAEIDNMREILKQKPSKGSAAMQTHAWAKKVDAAIKTAGNLPPVEAAAYKKIVTQLHADETKLAWLSYQGVPASMAQLNAAKKGYFNTQLIKDVEEGWKAIAGLGVQVPKELLEMWKPKLKNLMDDPKTFQKMFDAYDWYTKFFKTYAMASTGFAVRNAMSATFMNYVAGVPLEYMSQGVKMANAIRKHGPNWLDHLGIPMAQRPTYELAWRGTQVTSRGFGDTIAEPIIGGGVAEKIINNKVTRGFGKLNEFTERAVRLPMALDSAMRGHSLDDIVNRVTRYHFDYTDLSQLDKSMANFVPFWIWTSRNLPLQVASQFSRPAAYNQYRKLHDASPVNEDIFMPKWMQTINPIGISGGLVATPDMPFGRLSQTVEMMNPFNVKFVGQINPALKVPAELLLLNKQAAMDIPFNQDRMVEAKGMDAAIAWVGDKLGLEPVGQRDPKTGKLMITPKAQYFAGAVAPPISKAQRLGYGLTGGLTGGKESYQERTLTSWLNEIGIPLRQIGEDQQRSEAINRQFEMKDFAKWLEKQDKLRKK